uniref:Putative secreted protein n=1 Tax=Ixodes ricinus TaxID=34613 RepID=A0A6B0TTE3_IXORI
MKCTRLLFFFSFGATQTRFGLSHCCPTSCAMRRSKRSPDVHDSSPTPLSTLHVWHERNASRYPIGRPYICPHQV